MDSLKALRKKKGLTQKQLADRLGVAQNTISTWETGANKPDFDSLITLCSILDVTIGDLLDTPEILEKRTPENADNLKSASEMLGHMMALLKSVPPDELQKMLDLASQVLPQMNKLVDTDGNPLIPSFSDVVPSDTEPKE